MLQTSSLVFGYIFRSIYLYIYNIYIFGQYLYKYLYKCYKYIYINIINII